MNATQQYREIRPDGTREFTLSGYKLAINGRNPLKNDFSLTVDLTDASPDAAMLNVRPRIFFHLSALVVAFAAAAVASNVSGLSTDENFGWQICAVFAAIMAVLAASCAKKIRFTQFKSRSGNVLFDIARRGPDSAQYDSFVSSIAAAIAAAQPSPKDGSNQSLTGST